MPLNTSKGNMYEFVTHTWNTVKGKCFHDCSYCYMKRWNNQKPVRFDEKELKTDLGKGKFIFVGSSCDMWAELIPQDWQLKTIEHCEKYDGNKYLFQSKNPNKLRLFNILAKNIYAVCTTIESNRWYPEIMNKSPSIESRVFHMARISVPKYITIEPILDFDLETLVGMINAIQPIQVNIGADSGHNNLPEPPYQKVMELVAELSKFTKIENKRNLDRLK